MTALRALFAFAGIVAVGKTGGAQTGKPLQRAASVVPYTIVEHTGRFQNVVLISAKYRTKADLRRLGEELRDAFRNDRFAFAIVFDNPKAAKMFDRMMASGGSLGGNEDVFYDKHHVADYNKNMNTAVNSYAIYPYGSRDDRQIDVKY